MATAKTLLDFGYFDSEEETQRALERFSETRPLKLPENELLVQIAAQLTGKARFEPITAKELLVAYQKLRENHEHTDVFCGWKDSSGKRCGGLMDIEVDAAGAFYLCQVDNKHRTPK